jgi:hypothetical protein
MNPNVPKHEENKLVPMIVFFGIFFSLVLFLFLIAEFGLLRIIH